MKTTIGAIVIAVALISGVGAASAMPSFDGFNEWETVYGSEH